MSKPDLIFETTINILLIIVVIVVAALALFGCVSLSTYRQLEADLVEERESQTAYEKELRDSFKRCVTDFEAFRKECEAEE